MKGITIPEQCHIINALAPVDIGGAAKTTDYWSMELYSHASIIVKLGVVTNAPTIKIYESDDLSGTNKTFIAFDYYAEITAAGDILTVRTAATVAGYTFPATTNNVMISIEIDASQLTDGYPCMALLTDNAAACLIDVSVILSGAKYQREITPTAIA